MEQNNHLINLQKELYQYLKKRALSYELSVSKELRQYRNQQKRYVNKPFEAASFDQLFSAIRQSRVVYIGDFHTFNQSSRNLERLLRKLVEQRSPITIGVEVVHIKNQSYIDHYLNGDITELELLESIDYQNSWRFPWTHYRQFFQLAKQRGWKMLALNSEGSLSQRDRKAAQIITQALDHDHRSKLLVLFGELHILPDKIPAQVQACLGSVSIHQTIIHQNIDELYWRAKTANQTKTKGQTEVREKEILKFNDFEFTLQTAPPWIKYESMIYWYENFCADPEFDLHEYMLETGALTLDGQASDNFSYLIKHVAKTLGLKLKNSSMEDFNLHDYQKMDYLLSKIGQTYKGKLRKLNQHLLSRAIPFKLPGSNDYYCSSYSMNRFAYLAGLYLHAMGHEAMDDEVTLIETAPAMACLSYFMYQQAAGYLASKVINPYRKCDLYLDFKDKSQAKKSALKDRQNYQLCVDVLDGLLASQGKKSKLPVLSTLAPGPLYLLARRLGFLLGELIFNFLAAQTKPNKMTTQKIHELYQPLIRDPWEMSQDLKYFLNGKDLKTMRKRAF